MNINTTFTDTRERQVRSKRTDPVLDVEVYADTGDTETLDLPDTDRKRTLFIESSLDLNSPPHTTQVSVREDSSTIFTLDLAPGQAMVIPIEDGIDDLTFTSNAASAGKVRVVLI